MRNTLFFFIPILLSVSFIQRGLTYKEIEFGDTLVLTYDNNNGVIDWDKSGQNIVFESGEENAKKIFYLNLYDLPINFERNGFHSAKYVNELVDKYRVYVPLIGAGDTSFTSPKWSISGNKILSIGESKGENEVFITTKYSRVTKATGIKNIKTAHWKNDSVFYIVYKDKSKQLVEFNRINKKSKVLLETEHPIEGISKKKNTLFLACKGGAYKYSYTSKNLKWYKLPIKGKTVFLLGQLNFVGLNLNGSAQVLDLNNAITHPFSVGEKDGSPTLSNDEKFVAFYSGYVNGIVVKKIDKKFYLK
jgi:hypothetical protein